MSLSRLVLLVDVGVRLEQLVKPLAHCGEARWFCGARRQVASKGRGEEPLLKLQESGVLLGAVRLHLCKFDLVQLCCVSEALVDAFLVLQKLCGERVEVFCQLVCG